MTRTSTASVIGLLLLVVGVTNDCSPGRVASPKPPAAGNIRATAARLFTERYAHSRVTDWQLRARPAGADCAVLLIETPVILQESMIEAVHYGAGDYDIYPGGVQHFYEERSFRGVTYKDSTDRRWPYGAVTQAEADTLVPCR
jgi:hypothetical protein